MGLHEEFDQHLGKRLAEKAEADREHHDPESHQGQRTEVFASGRDLDILGDLIESDAKTGSPEVDIGVGEVRPENRLRRSESVSVEEGAASRPSILNQNSFRFVGEPDVVGPANHPEILFGGVRVGLLEPSLFLFIPGREIGTGEVQQPARTEDLTVRGLDNHFGLRHDPNSVIGIT